MANIQKREGKNGPTYRVQVRVHGFPPQNETFRRLSDAKTWAQQVEAAIHRGEFKSSHQEAKRHTLKDVVDRYRREILPNKAASTQRSESTCVKHWEAELGDYALSYIDVKLINEKLQALAQSRDARMSEENRQKAAKPISKRTLKHYRDILEMLLKHAGRWGLMGANPVEGVGRVTKVDNSRVRYLDDGEREALLKACKASDNKQLYPIVVFALSTGARLGEILKLQLAGLDFKRGSAILRDTKNGETRVVPVVEHLAEVLKGHLQWRETFCEKMDEPTPWLFPRRDGRAAIDIRKAWVNARDEAKIEDFRFHDLRHSAASYLAMNGASLLEIAAVLGHKTLQMVKRYSHLSEDHTRDIVTKMNKNIF